MFRSKNPGSPTTSSVIGALSTLLQRKRRPKTVAEAAACRLPTELYLPIFSFLSPDTKLHPLLFIDSGFHAEAERRLYTNISLAWDTIRAGKYQERDVRRRIKLFKTLARTPRLSNMVYSITIPPFNCVAAEVVRFKDRGLQPTYWHRLNLALRAVPNLKELSMGNFCAHQDREDLIDSQKHPAVFNGCTFRLRKLVLLSYAWDDFEALANCDVLGELEEISIPNAPIGFNAREAFPRLAVLEIQNRKVLM